MACDAGASISNLKWGLHAPGPTALSILGTPGRRPTTSPHGFRLPVDPPCAAGTGSDLHHQVGSSSARASHADPGRLVKAPSPLVFLDRLDVPTPSRSMGPSASVGHSGHPKRPLQPLRRWSRAVRPLSRSGSVRLLLCEAGRRARGANRLRSGGRGPQAIPERVQHHDLERGL